MSVCLIWLFHVWLCALVRSFVWSWLIPYSLFLSFEFECLGPIAHWNESKWSPYKSQANTHTRPHSSMWAFLGKFVLRKTITMLESWLEVPSFDFIPTEKHYSLHTNDRFSLLWSLAFDLISIFDIYRTAAAACIFDLRQHFFLFGFLH